MERVEMNASTELTVAHARSGSRWKDRLTKVNRELWLLLSLFIIAGVLNRLVASHGMVLGFYTLPTLFSAYVFGRTHAVLTAVGSVLLVVIVSIANPVLFVHSASGELEKWFDLGVWGVLLIVMAVSM